MAIDVEGRLQQYAHALVATNLLNEYNRQIGKWQRHFNVMVDAQMEAKRRHLKVLNEARQQIEAEQEAAFQLAMLALSFVAGPALSWVAGKIQYELFPKFASTVKERVQHAKFSGKHGVLITRESEHDKVWAKLFGDLGKEIVGLGIDKALKVVIPDNSSAKNAVANVPSSNQGSFKTNLENALSLEAELTRNSIVSLASNINENSNYGKDCLERLYRLYPSVKRSDPNLQLEMGKNMIRDDLNAKRERWALDWFYFGSDPQRWPYEEMTDAMEVEMWAMWLLNERLKYGSRSGYDLGPYGNSSGQRLIWAEGATFGKDGVPDAVLRRLADFDVVYARNQLQVREQTRRIIERKNAALDNPDAPPSKEDYPLHNVGTEVDSPEEITALETWAKNHPPRLNSIDLLFTSRSIKSIEAEFK